MVAMQPMLRYVSNGQWENTARSLVSPAPDGTVIYHQDALSPNYRARMVGTDDQIAVRFDDEIGRALCQYLVALAIRNRVDVAEGPFLQVLEDDGLVPPGWVMLRAMIWVGDYDVTVPVTPSAVDDGGLVSTQSGPAGLVGGGVVYDV